MKQQDEPKWRRWLSSLLSQIAIVFGTLTLLLLFTGGRPHPWMVISVMVADILYVAISTAREKW